MTLRIALVGCGTRGRNIYLPVIRKMRDHFELVGVCDRDRARSEECGRIARVPAFRSFEKMLDNTRPQLVIVAVTPPPSEENEQAALRAIEAGVHMLAETPIAATAEGARKVMSAAANAPAVIIEYAENYYRTPKERLVRQLLANGAFGNVHVAYSDFVGHGYHGISLLRSLVGFGVPVVGVLGLSRDYTVQAHLYRAGHPRLDLETWQFAVLEFANGAYGVMSFSTLAYGSPLRWGREKVLVRFYAGGGMRFGEELAILDENDETAPLVVEECWNNIEGTKVLDSLRVCGRCCETVWQNPLRNYPLRSGNQHSELTVALQCLSVYDAIRRAAAPEYGVRNAYHDRTIDFAIEESRRLGGTRVHVNLDDTEAGMP